MQAFITRLRTRFQKQANSERAAQQQSYMRSSLPFYGLQMPAVREVTHEMLREHPIENAKDLAMELFRTGTHREELIVAINILQNKKLLHTLSAQDLSVVEEIVCTGAWWDLVDSCSPIVSWFRKNFPQETDETLRAWAKTETSFAYRNKKARRTLDPAGAVPVATYVWRRRIAIISQLSNSKNLDTELLSDCLKPSFGEKEFFLCKAMGWALRDASTNQEAWVLNYLEKNEKNLSNLSYREARKTIDRKHSRQMVD